MNDEKRIYALGFFDGVHLGHQALLRECCRLAKEFSCTAAAITFDAHPQSLFSENPPALISTVSDRKRLLQGYGIDQVHIFPVSAEVMSTSWGDFLEQLLHNGATGFVCGEDFRFGHRGEGTAEKLAAFCAERKLPCVIVPEQMLDGTRISSSLIRTLIEAGNMERAAAFLGHPHTLSGCVQHGRQLGRTLGVPTANLAIPAGITVPKFGVYVCRVAVNGTYYPAVANVGTRPTVNGSHVTVEPWILGFEGDLYGKEIQLEFYAFLRCEIKFADLDALKQQIRSDAASALRYFETH